MQKSSLTERNTQHAAMRQLRRDGFTNHQIARYLRIPRSTVHLRLSGPGADRRYVDERETRRLVWRARKAWLRDDRAQAARAAQVRADVVSECCWMVRGDAAAQSAVRRYVQAMSAQPSSWWLSRGERSLSWWLNEVQSFTSDRMAA